MDLLRDLRTNVCLEPRSRVSGKDTTEDAEERGGFSKSRADEHLHRV